MILLSRQASPVVHGVVIYLSIALSSLGSNHQAVGSAGRREIPRLTYRKDSFLQLFIAPSASRGRLRYRDPRPIHVPPYCRRGGSICLERGRDREAETKTDRYAQWYDPPDIDG